jgi:peptidoglycan biosynthesis protein MviN/MurJ (putative lipid II flippase)
MTLRDRTCEMTAQQLTPPPRREEPTSIADVVDMVKAYAKQETLGPLQGVGRWLARGVAGAVLLGIGLSFVTLGILRLIQTEWVRSASGSLSWLAYLIAFVICVGFLLLAVSRINKNSLNKEPK